MGSLEPVDRGTSSEPLALVKTIALIVLLPAVFVVYQLGRSAAQSHPAPPITTGATREPTRAPTCSDEPVRSEVRRVLATWTDTVSLASKTPRMSLSPLIAKLQETRRGMEELQLPPCGAKAREASLALMNKRIAVFEAFLSDDHYGLGSITQNELNELRLTQSAALRTAFGEDLGASR